MLAILFPVEGPAQLLCRMPPDFLDRFGDSVRMTLCEEGTIVADPEQRRLNKRATRLARCPIFGAALLTGPPTKNGLSSISPATLAEFLGQPDSKEKNVN